MKRGRRVGGPPFTTVGRGWGKTKKQGNEPVHICLMGAPAFPPIREGDFINRRA